MSSFPDRAVSTVLEASRIIKTSPGVLYLVTGLNTLAATQYILVFDAVALPDEGTAPTIPIHTARMRNFFWEGGRFGWYCEKGIVVCNSSTPQIKTIGLANCWFNVLFK